MQISSAILPCHGKKSLIIWPLCPYRRVDVVGIGAQNQCAEDALEALDRNRDGKDQRIIVVRPDGAGNLALQGGDRLRIVAGALVEPLDIGTVVAPPGQPVGEQLDGAVEQLARIELLAGRRQRPKLHLPSGRDQQSAVR